VASEFGLDAAGCRRRPRGCRELSNDCRALLRVEDVRRLRTSISIEGRIVSVLEVGIFEVHIADCDDLPTTKKRYGRQHWSSGTSLLTKTKWPR